MILMKARFVNIRLKNLLRLDIYKEVSHLHITAVSHDTVVLFFFF